MTASRKAQVRLCHIGKFHAYLGIGYERAREITDKLGLERVSRHLEFKAWNHIVTATTLCQAALTLYPKTEEES